MLLILGVPREGWAAFTPAACSTSAWTEVSTWQYSISSSGNPSWAQPADYNCSGGTCPHYQNNIDYKRFIVANSYVNRFEFHVSSFVTESTYDALSYGIWPSLSSLSGTVGAGWYGASVAGYVPFLLRFFSDYSVTKPGVYLDKARVKCASTPNSLTNYYFFPYQRHVGVLLASQDVVYLEMPSQTGQGPDDDNHVAITLWAESASAGADFDLYVRCNALPTISAYDYRSVLYGSDERIDLDKYDCPGGTIYVAVHAYNGTGTFGIVNSPHRPNAHRDLKAGTNYVATSAQLATIISDLMRGTRLFYAATEGTIIIDKVDLWNNGSCTNCGGATCDICYKKATATDNCTLVPGGVVNIHQADGDFDDPEGLSHELLHCVAGLLDEYNNSNMYIQCGHTVMGWYNWTGLTNVCHGGTNPDHNKDPHPADGGPSAQDAGWTNLSNGSFGTGWVPEDTPDSFRYLTHTGLTSVLQH